jgi:hypothetical protein
MDKGARAKAVEQFGRFVKQFPELANAFVAQQVVLIEAAEAGSALVRERMTSLLRDGMVVAFSDYWEKRPLPLSGVLACLATNGNRDPLNCFPSLSDWFDDPLPEKLPPTPGPGPLKP